MCVIKTGGMDASRRVKTQRLDKHQSLAFLSAKAEAYRDGEGWRLLAVLKKMLSDNNINIKKKMAAWRKK